MKNNNICFIICYWGEWPAWFNYFLTSCKYNSEIDWLIFSDNKSIPVKASNIILFNFHIDDFNRLATKKLKMEIDIKYAYKICDFRPAYGIIFENYIKNYEFWGYSDIDIIFGDLKKYLKTILIKKYDIVSFYSGFLSGPLCIYKNDIFINRLFKNSCNYQKVFTSKKYVGFDENVHLVDNKKYSVSKILIGIYFVFRINRLIFTLAHNEIKYEFQWFYKRIIVNKKELIDMTDVVIYYTKMKKINSYFQQLIFSDRYYKRKGVKEWTVLYEKGTLIKKDTRDELLGFHFIDMKNDSNFKIKNKSLLLDKFKITNKGIYCF